MIDLFLKFPDEKSADDVLYTVGDGERMPRFESFSVVGLIYKDSGNTEILDGVAVPIMTPIDGWHVNLRGDFTEDQLEELKPYILDPAPQNPVRVWL